MPELIEIGDIPLSKPDFNNFDNLHGLFEEIEGLYINIVYHWAPVLFPKKYRDMIKQAWQEIAGTLRSIVRGNSSAELEDDREDRKDIWNDAGLRSLSNQLRLKLEVLCDAWKKFDENGSSRQLQGVIKIINLILGSICTEMKMVEKIKEFGEFIEAILSGNVGDLDSFLKTL